MTAALATGGFAFSRETAGAIVGIYSACVYLSALPGGWIADRLLGLRRAIWYGAILIALGHLSIALSIVFAHSAFFIGLILIVLGTGLLKPNISAIVGDLYPEGGSRRDAGFSIFYMGINLGALIAPLVTGYLGEKIAWHLGFGAAGVGMLIGVFTYWARADKTLGDNCAAGAPHHDGRHGNQPCEHCAPDDGCHRWTGVALLSLRLRSRRAQRRGEAAGAGDFPAFRFRVDLLVGLRAGSDIAESLRARFYRSGGVRLGDADALAAVGELGIRHRPGTGIRDALDRARQAW